MRKLLLLLILILLVFTSDALGLDRFSVGVGVSSDGISNIRVETQKGIGPNWFVSDTGFLSLSLNASADYWEKDEDDVYALSLIPLFTYQFSSLGATVHPFIEAGVGAAYISEKTINDRNLGIHFQFADIIGIGTYLGRGKSHAIRVRFIHYSNAGLDDDNDGISFYSVGYQMNF